MTIMCKNKKFFFNNNMFNLFNRTVSCSADDSFVFLLFDTIFMYLVLMAIVTLILYSLSNVVHGLKESQNILGKYTRNYKFKSKVQLYNTFLGNLQSGLFYFQNN